MYKLIRNILFLFPPEMVHQFSMNFLLVLCKFGLFRKFLATQFCIRDKATKKSLWGITFRNPVGLAAGFDKNALYLDVLDCLGFGFVEVGTVTPLPQAGNEKPRLFRLQEEKALINRMGFNNDGVKMVAERLKKWKQKNRDITNQNPGLIIGGNIGKNKMTPNKEAWKDYEICFLELFNWVDYFVVNVSSPNTPGLRELQEKNALKEILGHLQQINQKQTHPKPLLLKIAPDLSWQQIDEILELADEIKLEGIVAVNTTLSREGLGKKSRKKTEKIGSGGLSGVPLREKSTQILSYIHQKTNGKLPVQASGGIFVAKDAEEKFSAGAALVQVWTGFVYEGPSIVKNILNARIRNTNQNG